MLHFTIINISTKCVLLTLEYFLHSEDICWVIQIGLSPSLYEEHFIEVAMNDMDLHVTGDCNSQTSDQVVLVEGSWQCFHHCFIH